MATEKTWRSGAGVRTMLIAALCGTVAIGSYLAVSNTDATDQAEQSAEETPTTTVAVAPPVAPFTTADEGACLTWEVSEQGEVTGFDQTDCATEHRFEIAAREDLATYPTSEFGPNAAMPNQTRQAQLREELCLNPTVRYLDGQYDPYGKYSVAPILPSADAWERGDRTMLCGLQVTDSQGVPQPTAGRAAEQDQARVAEPGQCVMADGSNVLRIVDCAEDHAIEITKAEHLTPVFADHTPSIEEQDEHLAGICTQAAMDYLGGEEELYYSTLQPYWGTLPPESWVGGSRTVNCALVHANEEGGFSVLTGSAREGREGFTIDGQPPAERPEREPIVRDAPPPELAPEPGPAPAPAGV